MKGAQKTTPALSTPLWMLRQAYSREARRDPATPVLEVCGGYVKSDTWSTLPVGTFQDFQEVIHSQRQQHWVRP